MSDTVRKWKSILPPGFVVQDKHSAEEYLADFSYYLTPHASVNESVLFLEGAQELVLHPMWLDDNGYEYYLCSGDCGTLFHQQTRSEVPRCTGVPDR